MSPRSLTQEQVAALYESHGDIVWRRARSILGDDEAARDLVHDVFLKIWRDPSSFSGGSKPSTWLYAVATHAALQRLRDNKNRQRLLDARAVELHPNAASHGVDRTMDVRAFLARVPEAVAKVVVALVVDGLSQDDTAALLGITRRDVAKRLAQFHELAREARAESA